MAVTLTLGTVIFQNFEIPTKINFGGMQALAVHQLVGGARIIDSMGRIDDDISWSGIFFESTATERAQFLDKMRSSGNTFPLSFGQFNFNVIISDFKCSFERTYQIPYSITCKVIQNLTLPISTLLPLGYNDAIANQLTELQDLALLVANPSISSSMALLSAAIQNLPSIANATTLQLAPVVVAILNTQSAVTTAITQTASRIFS